MSRIKDAMHDFLESTSDDDNINEAMFKHFMRIRQDKAAAQIQAQPDQQEKSIVMGQQPPLMAA
jgi:hypothetical protein